MPTDREQTFAVDGPDLVIDEKSEIVHAKDLSAEAETRMFAQAMVDQFPPGFEWSDEEERPVSVAYSARDTAEILGVSERTIRRWIDSGRLAAEKDGGIYRVRLDDARAALAGSRVASGSAELRQRIEWLERENERLWMLLEKAVA